MSSITDSASNGGQARLVVFLLTVIAAVISGNWLVPILVLLPASQLLIMNPQHRQQVMKHRP